MMPVHLAWKIAWRTVGALIVVVVFPFLFVGHYFRHWREQRRYMRNRLRAAIAEMERHREAVRRSQQEEAAAGLFLDEGALDAWFREDGGRPAEHEEVRIAIERLARTNL